MDPLVLQICHSCRLVHEDRTGGWITKKAFQDATGVDPITCRLTHTYCPACYIYFLNKHEAA